MYYVDRGVATSYEGYYYQENKAPLTHKRQKFLNNIIVAEHAVWDG